VQIALLVLEVACTVTRPAASVYVWRNEKRVKGPYIGEDDSDEDEEDNKERDDGKGDEGSDWGEDMRTHQIIALSTSKALKLLFVFSAYLSPAPACLQLLLASIACLPIPTRLFRSPPSKEAIRQRLPLSSAYHSPATANLQRLPFSRVCQSPATANLQRLPFSSAYHSLATVVLQRLPFPCACHSLVTAVLQRLLILQ
jgi:hypothetical protein